jgi:2-keto-3-deoxy-L-rhamnonate aldolase RhmA
VLEWAGTTETPVLLFVADAAEAKSFRERGVTTTIIGSDQAFLRRAAAAVVREVRSD